MVLTRTKKRPFIKVTLSILFFVGIFCAIGYSLPVVVAFTVESSQAKTIAAEPEQFPVSVDPKNKVIVENAQVNMRFESARSTFQASVDTAKSALSELFAWVATTIVETPWYQSIGAVGGHFVEITPGMRKEQVASAFATALHWSPEEKKKFAAGNEESPALAEGSFSPGVYFVGEEATPEEAEAFIRDRF